MGHGIAYLRKVQTPSLRTLLYERGSNAGFHLFSIASINSICAPCSIAHTTSLRGTPSQTLILMTVKGGFASKSRPSMKAWPGTSKLPLAVVIVLDSTWVSGGSSIDAIGFSGADWLPLSVLSSFGNVSSNLSGDVKSAYSLSLRNGGFLTSSNSSGNTTTCRLSNSFCIAIWSSLLTHSEFTELWESTIPKNSISSIAVPMLSVSQSPMLSSASSNHTLTPCLFNRSASFRTKGLSFELWLRKIEGILCPETFM